MDNHNTSPSRALQLSPAMVGPEAEMQLRLSDLKRAGALAVRVDDLHIEPGTKVRLLTKRLKKTPKYVKGQEATWTPEIYTVVERAGVNSFRIDAPGENKIWPVHELQVVNKALGQTEEGEKIVKRIVAAQNKEARNISEESQAAALKGPAREKRVPKPTEKMSAYISEKENIDPSRDKRVSKRVTVPTAKALALSRKP